MRRLSLILSDLYLPAGAESGQLPVATGLPNLEWMLRVAGRRERHDQWRAIIAAQLGRYDLLPVAPAEVVARDQVPACLARTSWLATPVNFEARLDHVRLTPAGLLSLAADERTAWRAEFARAFGPDLTLHDAGPRAFLLTGVAASSAETLDPARLLGCDISQGLPRGPDANPLRRLGTEIEMWAHGSELNRDRARRRLPMVSGLWLWGGKGFAGAVAEPATDYPGSIALAGEDPFLQALSRMVTGEHLNQVPQQLDLFAPEADYRIVELAPMTNARQSLAHLDAHWFGPAAEALRKGALDLVDIFANDHVVHVVQLDRLNFWRRRRSWLQSLA
jgi:hypothetical protein